MLGGRWAIRCASFMRKATWRRASLISDTAHTMHPSRGRAQAGLRGVAALAEVMVEAKRLGLDPGAATVLERYQRWRRFDNQLLLTVTDSLSLFSNDLAPVRGA